MPSRVCNEFLVLDMAGNLRSGPGLTQRPDSAARTAPVDDSRADLCPHVKNTLTVRVIITFQSMRFNAKRCAYMRQSRC